MQNLLQMQVAYVTSSDAFSPQLCAGAPGNILLFLLILSCTSILPLQSRDQMADSFIDAMLCRKHIVTLRRRSTGVICSAKLHLMLVWAVSFALDCYRLSDFGVHYLQSTIRLP